MKWMNRAFGAGGVAAFFFFSWIIQLLWNSILVDQLALVGVKLSYWQAAALWFLVTLLFAWVGIGASPGRWYRPRRRRDWEQLGDRIEKSIRLCVSRWADDDEDLDDIGERIEAKIKRGFARWVDVDEDTEWDDLGEHIERKIKRKVQEWAEEE